MVKKPPTNEVDMSWIPGVGNGNPLQYSCLENSMGRGAWRATVHGVAKESDLKQQQFDFSSPLGEATLHRGCMDRG